MKTFSSWFRDIAIGVLVTVIGGLLLNYFADISPKDIFTWLLSSLSTVFSYVSGSTPVYRWFLALLILLSSFWIISWISSFKHSVSEPTFRDYTEDIMDGVRWRWNYSRNDRIVNLWCYCPDCETMLVYSEDYDLSGGGLGRIITTLKCERCNCIKASIKGDKDYVLSKVERFIDRSIRVGDWKK